MLKQEAKLTTKLKPKLLKWAKETAVFEIKVARDDKFYYSSGSFPQQRLNLKAAKDGKQWYKHPDASFSGTPWDVSIYVNCPAYLVVFFDKNFYVLDIDDVLLDNKKHKSLNEERAKALCKYYDNINISNYSRICNN